MIKTNLKVDLLLLTDGSKYRYVLIKNERVGTREAQSASFQSDI